MSPLMPPRWLKMKKSEICRSKSLAIYILNNSSHSSILYFYVNSSSICFTNNCHSYVFQYHPITTIGPFLHRVKKEIMICAVLSSIHISLMTNNPLLNQPYIFFTSFVTWTFDSKRRILLFCW